MYSEDELLAISGLQHLEFCERQWALIHIERAWEENRLTAEGRLLHERVHEGGDESRPLVVECRGLPIRSLRLGLSGVTDVVEFQRVEAEEPGVTVRLAGRDGWWRPFPVEYKRGRPKGGACDEVQVCAQALCLEEMLGVQIGEGALYYGKTRRRKAVTFDAELRTRTERLSARMHELYRSGATPKARYGAHCERCSLAEVCAPQATEAQEGIEAYLDRTLREDG
jgi:CRISPR-associated exonuclease Cas4